MEEHTFESSRFMYQFDLEVFYIIYLPKINNNKFLKILTYEKKMV